MNFGDSEDTQPDSGLYSRMIRKNVGEVTLEDVANLDCITISCDEPVHLAPDTSRLNTILDITSFKPFKPLSRKEEKAAKTKETPPVSRRKLPFNSKKNTEVKFSEGVNKLKTHEVRELEQDYYQSLMDMNARFQKYVPKLRSTTDSLMLEFRLSLAEGKIWRSFHMDSGTRFSELRRAILDLMGWEEDRSWSFMYVNKENQLKMVGETGPLKTDLEIQSEEQLVVIETLHESYCKFCFVYDLLGTKWRLDLCLTKIMDRPADQLLPVCVRGKGLLHFPLIRSPEHLTQVCSVLKDPAHPKRPEYLSTYNDLLMNISVVATPFPSFYTVQEQVESTGKGRKTRKRASERPILVSLSLEDVGLKDEEA